METLRDHLSVEDYALVLNVREAREELQQERDVIREQKMTLEGERDMLRKEITQQPLIKELASCGLQFCDDLAEEGTPWEVAAEPEPQYFATLTEAIQFRDTLFASEARERAENALRQVDEQVTELINIAADVARRRYLPCLEGARTLRDARAVVAAYDNCHVTLTERLRKVADSLRALAALKEKP